MADKEDLALMAHLLRRAGFGASRDELEARVAQGYDNVVDELLDPGDDPGIDMDLLFRAYPNYIESAEIRLAETEVVHRMIHGKYQLREKIALFWHTTLCSADNKLCNERNNIFQYDAFRDMGLGSYKDLLLYIARDPCMIYYLDNQDNHKGAINENFGRELLELFALGVGMDGQYNYTQEDVMECARAFTGYGLAPNYPAFPYGRTPFYFRYDATDHDDGEKTFLGETGDWNGEDIIEIICKQPACARFIARKLYDWFVADEPSVPNWMMTPPRDMEAIEQLEKAYFDSGYEIRSMLRVLFKSDFFKNSQFAKVKSPADVVAASIRMAHGVIDDPYYPLVLAQPTKQNEGILIWTDEVAFMGMEVLQPPTVEGWHMGLDWINSGSILDRVNFAAKILGNTELPGVKSMVQRLMARGESLSPEELVDGCLDLLGPIPVPDATRQELVDYAAKGGELRHGTEPERDEFTQRTGQMFQLIVSTSAYQFG